MLMQAVLVAGLALAWPEPAKDPVFDLPALLAPPLEARVLKSTEKDGIVTEEVMFHSEKDGDKRVDIFAYFSYPKGAKKLPAFVWNQGGLYQATTYWTEFGAKRGYAALCIDFPIGGYRSTGGYPINSNVELGDDPKKAPIYHGAVALLRAVSFLESRPEVDKERIGMTGSSWGGYYTTLMVGIDGRLKVGSSMFGSGGLELGNAWWDGGGPNPQRDDAFRQRWIKTLDPAPRLALRKTPMAWFTGTNDSFYWLPGVMHSFDKAGGPKHLALLPNWNHAMTPTLDEQVFVWLDIHLKGAPGFLQVSPLDKDTRQVRWTFKGDRKPSRAEAMISYGGPGNWHHRHWMTVPAEIKGDTCIAQAPASPLPGFVIGNVIDQDGFHACTPMLALPATDPSAQVPAFNGCEPWGDFEDKGIEFLRLHGLPVPALSKTAKSGSQSAQLKAGKTAMNPVHFIAGQAHTLSAYLKAEQATKVVVQLEGSFDGKRAGVEKEFAVGSDWTQVSLDFTPPEAKSGSLGLVVTVPKGAVVLVDDVQMGAKKR